MAVEMKHYAMLFHIIIPLTFLCKYSVDADTFVSQRNGKDDASCGTILLPCLSLQYTFAYKIKPEEHIRLDGGEKKPYVYVVNKPIHIANEISIKSYQNSFFRPIIFMVKQNQTIKEYMFLSVGKKKITLRVENIDFQSTPLLMFNTSCDVAISNCSFNGTSTTVIRRYAVRYKRWSKFVKLRISYTTFKNVTAISLSRAVHIRLVIYKCVFEGDEKKAIMSITHISKTGIVSITKSTISTGVGPLISFDKNCVSSVNIFNTTFYGNKLRKRSVMYGLLINFCVTVLVSESALSNYRQSSIYFNYVKNAKVIKCSFKNNQGFYGGAIRSRRSQLYVQQSSFSNNTASNGGAIHSLLSKTYITQCTFFYNAANNSGGAIYVSSYNIHNVDLQIYNSVMYATATNTFITGLLLRSNVITLLKNVKFLILNSLIDAPSILEGFSFEKGLNRHHNGFQNVSFYCPNNYDSFLLSTTESITSAQCHRCSRGMYNINKGIVMIVGKSRLKRNIFLTTKSNFTCFKCPAGGKCEEKVRSRANFWGYVGTESQVYFLPCPSYYCCSHQCESYNDCNKHREGILCGTCKKGFRLNFYNEDCIKNNDCHMVLSWLLLTFYSACYVLFLMYYKTLLTLLVNIISKYFVKRDKIFFLFKTKIFNYREDPFSYALFDESEEESENEAIANNEYGLEVLSDRIMERMEKTEEINEINKFIGSEIKAIGYGIKTIVFFFYQMELLIHIPATEQDSYGYLHQLKTTISNIFNLQLIQLHLSKICFVKNLDAVSKRVIKVNNVFMLMLVLLIAVGLIFFIRQIRRKTKSKCFEHLSQCQVIDKIRNCFIQVALLGYTSVSTFCFTLLHCVKINNQKHLFIQGDVICYTWWQYCILIITLLWVFPFGVSVYLSIKMLQRKQLSVKGFYFSLAFPLSSFYFYFRSVCHSVKLNITSDELTKIRSICEIFTGAFRSSTFGQINWESVVIVRRLLIAVICNFVMNPVARMMLTIPLLLSYLVHHLYVSPYRSKFLNHLETISLSFLLIINVENLFFAFVYMNDQSSVPGINAITKVCVWIQHIILTAPFLIIIVIVVVTILRMTVFAIKTCIGRCIRR
ncbi:uncharacterized protein LOC130622314 [Hydractinia symbiolongicarpus]|uniref:uncharacterized protein LOC130622314 n=1 Tax=Hydractinia symbiolongicarpus TaxID=13093 RepID=UPI00254E65F1|nr:uncharacterized protein LOC130622314 [Hydractinia symbiolongicarpus]